MGGFAAMPILRLVLLCLALVLPVAPAAQESGDTPWYQVEAINPGLGAAPDRIDRTTPQAAIESFLTAGRGDNWEAAAHLLDLAGWPEDEQAEVGPRLARQLFTVIDRKIVVNWYHLLDRPDALDARAAAESAMAGQPRRSLMLALVELDGRPVSLRLNRMQAPESDPVWLFSRQSVDNVPALYKLYGPSRLEALLPAPLRERAFWGLRWWEVIGLPLVLGLAVGLARLTYMAMSRGLGRTRRDEGSESILVALRPPMILAVVSTTLALFTQHFFLFSGRVDTLLSPLIAIGFVGATIWAVINLADTVMDRLLSFDGDALTATGEGQEKKRELATKVAAIRRATIVIVVIAGAGIILREANLMQTLGFSLLASAGAFTLVLAFAARNMLANIMASMQIALNQSARIGDKIVFQGHLCSVERIHFTYVQLREWTGKRIVVPVVDFAQEPFENWTMRDPAMIGEVRLRLAHDADVPALRERYYALLDHLDDRDEIAQKDDRGVYVAGHDAFGQEVLFMVPCPDPNTAWARICEVREGMLTEAARLAEDGRPIFPQVSAAEPA
ncbi:MULTISPECIES: mechanosensitive ion channel family protein [unclassified Roseivivax]|uniref:mechanosensitive ion channel family protein n=1 Tax=Roseivivax sp. GX 12232 TaxID=2900547 RepID=UPI001E448A00|nr:mechanosensitive ion channel domain-containing protein [Roseivivax sp. GX 12232]MCE0504219.1 mechanosensitive ion channel family protein [Roseivivax sp. GX 12232]